MSRTSTEPEIRLRPLERMDLHQRVTWFNAPSIRKSLILPCRLDYETTCRWFDKLVHGGDREDFVIETVPESRSIGMIGFRKIDNANRSAGFYVVIGERSYRGRGIGTVALRQLLERGWRKLRLHKVWCVVRSTNQPSLAMLRRVGFVVEGLLRKEERVSGRWIDVVRLGILRTDYANDTSPRERLQPVHSRKSNGTR